MRKKQSKLFLLVTAVAILLLLATGCGGGQQANPGTDKPANEPAAETPGNDAVEPVTLTMVSFLATDHPFTGQNVQNWIDKVKEETNGAVEIEWVGGPESIPVPDQFDAVINGIVDIGFNVSSYYGHLMPESNSLHLSPFTPAEERENGYFDYLNKRFDERNLVYLGRWLSPSNYYFWSNKKVESLADLKGTKFRSNPTYHDIMQAIDIVPVEVVPSDVYTSLERNMVDGFGFPLLGPRNSGWTEVTKYIIDEPFLNQNATILINKQAFEALSPELQEKMKELTAEYEEDMIAYFNQKNAEEWEALKAAGVEVIKFSDEESKKFQQIVSDVKWEALAKDSPDQVEELKSLLLK